MVSTSVLSHTIAKLSLKAKSRTNIAEIVKNGAHIKRKPVATPKTFVHVAGYI
jgi:hypothetical protein